MFTENMLAAGNSMINNKSFYTQGFIAALIVNVNVCPFLLDFFSEQRTLLG